MEALLKLKRNKGATAKKKRLGRGNGSGLGSYSGRGGKGQTARTGGNIKPGFAGGQTPLYRKMPKYKGFNNLNRIEYQVINLSDLESFFDEGSEVNATTLHAKKLIRSAEMPVKLLANGELSKKLSITVNKASDSAKEKLSKSKSTLKVLTAAKSEAKSE